MIVSKDTCGKLADVEIIRKALEEVDFFSCLYDRYSGQLLRYIHSLVKIGDQEAEDILQDAFIKVWRNLNGFDQRQKFSSWLYRIVHNETVSAWRRMRAKGKGELLSLREDVCGDVTEFEDQGEEERIKEQQQERTQAVLDGLPLKYREVLILRFFERMRYDEISDVLQLPEGTVATRINRAKRAFEKAAEKQRISFN